MKLSEEEIIKYIKDEIENDKDTANWFEEGHPTRKQIEEGINAYQGLLDLYNKEKEKNKELNENYISKDKIREKIKEVEYLKMPYQEGHWVIELLEELLEE